MNAYTWKHEHRFSIARKQITRYAISLGTECSFAAGYLRLKARRKFDSVKWREKSNEYGANRWRDKSINRCRTKRTNSSTNRSWFKSPQANCRRARSKTRFHEMLLTREKRRPDEGATIAYMYRFKTRRVVALLCAEISFLWNFKKLMERNDKRIQINISNKILSKINFKKSPNLRSLALVRIKIDLNLFSGLLISNISFNFFYWSCHFNK